MRIAIHNSEDSFSSRWIDYCESNQLNWKSVNCFESNIIDEIQDCDALFWHFHQNNPKSILCARQILYTVEASGKKVFPDFNTVWHFDDKLGQKYLFEALKLPTVPTWIFYEKKDALLWAKQTAYPKVFKLRGGAGSQNVRLVKDYRSAERIIKKAFGLGIPTYDPIQNIKERYRLYNLGKTDFRDLAEGLARFVIPPPYSRLKGKEKGYVYFQEYIPDNDHDIRVIVIKSKAFAIKRMVRKNDFRASGSASIFYDKTLFDERLIRLSFSIAKKIKSQCVAFDYVHKNGNPLLVEISYGFSPKGYDKCPGYWDEDLRWHEGEFNPYGWMIENLIKEI